MASSFVMIFGSKVDVVPRRCSWADELPTSVCLTIGCEGDNNGRGDNRELELLTALKYQLPLNNVSASLNRGKPYM